MSPAVYDASTAFIPATHQPALVLEHLRSLDLPVNSLLASAGLASLVCDGPGLGDGRVSPAQLLALLRAAAQAQRDPELSFQLGRQMLPGHFGPASHALLTAGSLRRALQVLAEHAARLSPLLVPHWGVVGRQAVLVWTDSCGSAGLRSFLVEMQMSALACACQWLAGERLPWTFVFNRGAPTDADVHQAYLGSRLRFACHLDAMLIDAEWLDRPWANPRAINAPTLQDALDREASAQEPRQPLLGALYRHLQARVQAPPLLEDVAQHFGLSPATFKRRLAACGTHYQAELDQVRLHEVLRLMHGQGLDNEAIGQRLGLDDPANFRRAMRRWAGLTPAQLRMNLGPG